MNNKNKEMRLTWFSDRMEMHIPVKDEVEAYKFMVLLGAYDYFQENANLRNVTINTGFLEVFNEEDNEWYDWEVENDLDYYGDYKEYVMELDCSDELESFEDALYNQEN